MPALKRQQAQLYDDDDDDDNEEEGAEEVVDIESAQSSLRQDNNKRLRISDEETGYHENNDSDSTDEELDILHATQFGERKRKRTPGKNQPADNGVIESITCTNFMCHSFLEVAIGPLINFVIGHNGSGKSAVLTALSICLGGKASSTNRAGNLKAFIREGQDSCILSVRLKNAGDTGYQQDVYGESIIIERHFNRAGTSGFKLKSSTGKIISTRKADLEDISDYYALQIDNPMTVLTQDMARQFLNNSTPFEKYKFFIKGVQLEQLSQDYQLLEENVDYIESTFYDKMEAANELKAKAEEAKKLVKVCDQYDTIRQKFHRLGCQMAWVQVEEQERYLETYDKDINNAANNVVQMEAKVEKTSEDFRQADEILKRTEASTEDLRKQCEPIIIERDAAKEKFDGVRSEAKQVQIEQRSIKEALRNEDDRIKKYTGDIADEYRRLEEANGGSHAKRLAELDQRKAEIAEAEAALEEHKSGLSELEGNQLRAKQASDDLKGPRSHKEQEIQQCKENLQALSKDRGQRLGGYPPNMTQLLNAIKQDHGFQHTPVGPIGEHVRLLKPIWSGILEKSFGSSLNSFIVTSKVDQTKLSSIMQKVKCSCPILIGNNNMFEFSHNEPDQEFDTSLRVLAIDHPLVLRQMIINQGIEQTVLIEDMEHAREIMDQSRLRNVKQCYSINNRGGLRLTYGWEGGLSSTYVDSYRGIPRMKTDIEVQIGFQRDTLKRLEQELSNIDRRYRDLQRAEEECNKAITRHHRRTAELKAEVRRAESVLDELLDAMDKDAVQEGRLDTLKEGLAEAERDKTRLESSYQESVIARDKHMADMNDCRQNLTNLDKRVEEAQLKVKKAESKLSRLTEQRLLALRDKNATIFQLQEARDTKLDLEQGRDEKVALVAEFVEAASKICPRIPIDPGETGLSLEKKMKQVQESIEKFEARIGGDKQKITDDSLRATQAYNKSLFQLREEEKLAQLLKTSLMHRNFRWERFRKFITARARGMFIYLLSSRGFRGRLTVNHKLRTLDLSIQPDETQSNNGRQTKTLSGGEKSFSTICLLLSLWEAMGAPIRCLDEFDVFMDSVNRDISMGLLIDTARDAVGKQFIFITPQSMTAVDRELDVKIIKMRDPERNQTTINFPKD